METDELYVGVDKKGVHFAFPIQATGGKDKLSIIQIEQDVAVCRDKFPQLVCRPIAAEFTANNVIALFEFELDADAVVLTSERHYRLVPPEEMSDADLQAYRARKAE